MWVFCWLLGTSFPPWASPPGPETVNSFLYYSFLPSLVQMAPPGAAILDTCYGAAGVLMWYQRERSLVPCSLMALMR